MLSAVHPPRARGRSRPGKIRVAAYLVYLHLYGQAARAKWRSVPTSLRMLAEATGLSKSAVQSALENLRRRELIVSASEHSTALPDIGFSATGQIIERFSAQSPNYD
jgi:DNA-binding transcriptional MocR family regulator